MRHLIEEKCHEIFRYIWQDCKEAIYGNLEAIKYTKEVLKCSNNYPDLCAKGAAFGGQIHVLEYFKNSKGIDWYECLILAIEGGRLGVVNFCKNMAGSIGYNRDSKNSFVLKEEDLFKTIKYRIPNCDVSMRKGFVKLFSYLAKTCYDSMNSYYEYAAQTDSLKICIYVLTREDDIELLHFEDNPIRKYVNSKSEEQRLCEYGAQINLLNVKLEISGNPEYITMCNAEPFTNME